MILISGALTTEMVGLVRQLTPMKAPEIIAINLPTALVAYASYLVAMAFFY